MMREPYSTTLLRGHDAQKLTHELEVSFIMGTLVPATRNDGTPSSTIFEIPPGEQTIGALVAPKLFQHRGEYRTAFDTRASKRVNREGAVSIASPSDYRFQLLEAQLTQLWVTQGPALFSQVGTLPIKVYSRWVSENIVRRLGLDPLTQLKLSILCAYFYMAQFIEGPIEETRKYGIANVISRALGVPPQTVVETILPVGELTDILSLVNAMKASGGSERLEVLNLGILYTLLSPSWFGANGRTIVGVAVEYVPTFLAMLYSAFNDRSYHSSYFAKTAVASDKRQNGREVIVAIDHLTRGAPNV